MTNEEAIRNIEIAKAEVGWNYPKDYAIAFEIAFEMAIEALEKIDKYRWHDLRKDPDDLPRDDSMLTYYECVSEGFEEDCYHPCYRYDQTQDAFGEYKEIFDSESLGLIDAYFETVEDMGYAKVIAWREIEPFEDNEE